ncbi:phage tail assembly chaperone [Phyllobacterium calauticae]|uniref:phage tail assembly chaperone n=1 Tax=Phyllobacterium calauticae TaxID=2817027 RepID=UPI001CBC6BA8|nr:hypothetical protein [Phyllobacterium calauticae]MBZ3690984.1 hypothetical protein [Phyllobacterium calauticae]
MKLRVRYELPDENGETRRERNTRFNADSPIITIEDTIQYLWDWFWEMSDSRSSGMNGPNPISHQDLMAWCQFSGNILLREEWRILTAMDNTYREAIAIENKEQAERQKEKTGK